MGSSARRKFEADGMDLALGARGKAAKPAKPTRQPRRRGNPEGLAFNSQLILRSVHPGIPNSAGYANHPTDYPTNYARGSISTNDHMSGTVCECIPDDDCFNESRIFSSEEAPARNSELSRQNEEAAGEKAVLREIVVPPCAEHVSFFEEFEAECRELNPAVLRLASFLDRTKREYTALKESYCALRSRYALSTEQVKDINKQLSHHVDRVNKLIELCDGLKRENTQLRDREQTFALYKREIDKYIETFKKGFEGKGGQLEEYSRQINELTRENIQCKYELDVLRRESHDRNFELTNILRKKEVIEANVELLRKRLLFCEGQLRACQAFQRRMAEGGAEWRNVMYGAAVHDVGSAISFIADRASSISGLIAAVRMLVAKLTDSLQKADRRDKELRSTSNNYYYYYYTNLLLARKNSAGLNKNLRSIILWGSSPGHTELLSASTLLTA